eukprot:TRINITY_DN173_c0_g1_i1.p1 TRINITY_DN173_c0_g1~~TRINITY_DN173_c0_g1_i1.p1  ORF type:complete len:103 (-),score=9.48 TRINITY_DN173_c0_g1_i1:84-392(-)
MYFATLGGLYTLFLSGTLSASNLLSVLDYIHATGWLDTSQISPKASTFALAWIATKFTEPIRFGLTLYVTPKLHRLYLRCKDKQQHEEETTETNTTKSEPTK